MKAIASQWKGAVIRRNIPNIPTASKMSRARKGAALSWLARRLWCCSLGGWLGDRIIFRLGFNVVEKGLVECPDQQICDRLSVEIRAP